MSNERRPLKLLDPWHGQLDIQVLAMNKSVVSLQGWASMNDAMEPDTYYPVAELPAQFLEDKRDFRLLNAVVLTYLKPQADPPNLNIRLIVIYAPDQKLYIMARTIHQDVSGFETMGGQLWDVRPAPQTPGMSADELGRLWDSEADEEPHEEDSGEADE